MQVAYLEEQLHALLSKLIGKASESSLRDPLDEGRRTMKKLEKEVDENSGRLGLLSILGIHLLVLLGSLGSSLDGLGEEKGKEVGDLLWM